MENETPDQSFKSHYKVIAPLLMGKGVGDGLTTMCVMSQAACIDALRKGLTLDKPTDEMECACRVLRRIAICLNDGKWWESNKERTEYLRPLIPLLLDSKQSKETTLKRIYYMANQSVKFLTPMRLRWRAAHCKDEKIKKMFEDGASSVEALTDLLDRNSCIAAKNVCQKLQSAAAADAAAAVDADVDAAAAAYAYAAADAAADAAAYAYADADADVASQKIKYRDALIEAFKECAKIVDVK